MAKDKKEFKVVEITTSTEPKIKDEETGEVYSLLEALCLLLNETKDIKKAVE